MRSLTIDELQVFMRIAALGNLSAAARERGVPASNASRTLARVERACGVSLVRRSTHGLSLTAEGELFLAHCRRTLQATEEVEAELAARGGALTGTVRVSASPLVMQHWIVPSLPGLQALHPLLRLELLSQDHSVDMVRDGVDLAVRTGDAPADTLAARPLGRIATGLFAAPAHLARHGVPGSAGDLKAHPRLGNCAHPVLNEWRFNSGRDRVAADGPLKADSTATILAMALHGLGVAQLPLRVAEPLVAQGRLARVLQGQFESAEVPVRALMLPAHPQSPKLRACIDHLVAVFAAAPSAGPSAAPLAGP